MSRIRGQGGEFAAESGRDSVVDEAVRRTDVVLSAKAPRYISSGERPSSKPMFNGNTRMRVSVPGASKMYMTLGGKKSMERLREFEWL